MRYPAGVTQRLFALALVGLAAFAHAEDPAIALVRKRIEAARKADGVVGMSVVVVKDGKVVLMEGFGQRDAACGLRATSDTVYDIGSATKSFTGLLLAQAAQEGRLSLADRPTKYLPAFRLKDPAADAKITLGDLMAHRSGLPRMDLAWYAGDFTRDELLQIAAQAEPTAPFGTKFQYQNLMVAFAGFSAAKAYGEPYEALLHERFFGPLGMAHSGATYDETRREPQLAQGYVDGGRPTPLKRIDNVAPAGSVSSSVRDMARYLQMLLAEGTFEGRPLFSKTAIEETRRPRIEMAPGSGKSYGMGWMLGTEHGAKSVYHGGNIDGFTAFVSLLPEKGIGVVALSNKNAAAAPQAVAGIVYDALLPAEPAKQGASTGAKLVEASASDLGDYHLAGTPLELGFVREGGRTFMRQGGQKIPMTLVGEKRYSVANIAFLTFGVPGKDGKPALRLEQGKMDLLLTHPEPFKSPIDAYGLLAKVVEAEGGAEAIRRHPQIAVRYRQRMPSAGVEIYGVRWQRDAASQAEFGVMYALNRRFATTARAAGPDGVVETTSFSLSKARPASAAPDEVALANLETDLQPRRFYKSVDIVREEKVGDVPTFVLQKTLSSGAKILDSVSKAAYRILRRQTSAGGPQTREEFSDFRTVDGLTIPFRSVSTDMEGGKSIEEVLSVRFDEAAPAWPFRAP